MKDGSAISSERNFLNAKEAAAFCRISIHTLYRLVKNPDEDAPPHKWIGGTIRFPRAKFIAWAENTEG